jgi:hypothetical protein
MTTFLGEANAMGDNRAPVDVDIEEIDRDLLPASRMRASLDAGAVEEEAQRMTSPEYEWRDPRTLARRPPFSDLFPIRPDVRERVLDSMRKRGFDHGHSIHVWRAEGVILDGHTRCDAAIEAGLPEVRVIYYDFADEEEAMDHAIANQRDRRNLDQSEWYRLIQAADRPRLRGGDHTSEVAKAIFGNPKIAQPSHLETAERTGASADRVNKVRNIAGFARETGDTTEEDAVKGGTMTINQADRAVKDKKRRCRKEDVERCVAWLKKRVSREEVLEAGFTTWVMHEARAELGWARKRAKKEKDVYSKIVPTNGQVPALEPHPPSGGFHPEDQAWVEGLPLRAQLFNPRKFESDAIVCRHFAATYARLAREVRSKIGDRSPACMTQLHRRLARCIDLPGPELWDLCPKCEGSGIVDLHSCHACVGGGYIIPHFTRSKA